MDSRDEQALRLDGLEEGEGDSGALSELLRGQQLVGLAWGLPVRRGADQLRDQRLVGGVQPAGEEVLDRGEGQTLLLELSDALQALQVLFRVPGGPALPHRRREQPPGLIEAHGVHAHCASARKLVHPISHEQQL
jgi:hypothetical protein